KVWSVLVLVANLELLFFGQEQLSTAYHNLVAGREIRGIEPAALQFVACGHFPAYECIVFFANVRPGLAPMPDHGRGRNDDAVLGSTRKMKTRGDAHSRAQSLPGSDVEIGGARQGAVALRCGRDIAHRASRRIDRSRDDGQRRLG